MVANELAIPTDMKVDPLTSVAIGAVHYATVFDWGGQKPQPAITPDNMPRTPRDVLPEEEEAESPRQSRAAHPELPETAGGGGKDGPVQLDYASPTADSETSVFIHIVEDLGDAATIQIEAADGWASDFTDITPDAEIKIPVKQLGINEYSIRYFDKRDRLLDEYDQKFSVTRSESVMPKIPATQTIAVKALDHLQGQTNVLVPLITKGVLLPARGKAQFKSARDLPAGSSNHLSFELFQVEYPERIELNLCVGVFRISGSDLPVRYRLKVGDPIIFNWKMLESGILQATVTLPQPEGKAPIELRAPRFYSPQASEMNFDFEQGGQFAVAVLRQAEEEWGDLVAALGPEAGKDVNILKLRIADQKDLLAEAGQDPELIRKVSEESRLVRQDIARLGKKHRAAILQRQLGKLTAIFNRLARAQAEKEEIDRFGDHIERVQKIIDEAADAALPDAERHFAEMRDIFFAAAWRDDKYVGMWFDRLKKEPYLFPDQVEFTRLLQEGEEKQRARDTTALRKLVSQMLDTRIAISANDTANELATIVKA